MRVPKKCECCSREVVNHDGERAGIQDIKEEFLERWKVAAQSEREITRWNDNHVVCACFTRLNGQPDGFLCGASACARKDGDLSETVRVQGLAGCAYDGGAFLVR